jgi:hypothetical protein
MTSDDTISKTEKIGLWKFPLFILVVYLRAKKNFWSDVGTGVESDPPVAGESNRLLLLLR